MDCACCNKKINEWRTAVLPGGAVTWQNCYADQMMETRGYGARIDLSVASVSGAENIRLIPNPHFSLSLFCSWKGGTSSVYEGRERAEGCKVYCKI